MTHCSRNRLRAHSRGTQASSYFKKLNLPGQGYVVQMRRVKCQIGRRVDPGECPEVVIKIRLVEIAARKCNLRPIDFFAFQTKRQHSLKSPHTAKQFRRQPYLPSKHLNESACTQSNLVSYVGNS